MEKDRVLFFRDLADALRLEASDSSPQKAGNQKEFTLETMKIIEVKYQRYFSEETLLEVEGIEDRVVSFMPGAYWKYCKLLGSDLGDVMIEAGGFYDPRTGVIGLGSGKKVMTMAGAERFVHKISEILGLTRRSGIRVFRNLIFAHNIIHELLHVYQVGGLPIFFQECAIPYYIDEIQGEMGFGEIGIAWGETTDRIDFYKVLLERFGEGVHGVLFGGNEDKEFRNKVFSAFTPEILMKLFPDGYGETKEEMEEFKRQVFLGKTPGFD